MRQMDLTTIDLAATGNPKTKVVVTKGWLRAVHTRLVAAERAEAELGRRKREEATIEALFAAPTVLDQRLEGAAAD